MDQTAKLSVVYLEAPSLPINNQLEATMRRIAITLSGLVGMAAAFTAPAAAYETDPLTGQPVQYYYGQPYYYGQQPFYGPPCPAGAAAVSVTRGMSGFRSTRSARFVPEGSHAAGGQNGPDYR